MGDGGAVARSQDGCQYVKGFFLTHPSSSRRAEASLAGEFGRRKSTGLDLSLFFSFSPPTYRKQPLCLLVLFLGWASREKVASKQHSLWPGRSVCPILDILHQAAIAATHVHLVTLR